MMIGTTSVERHPLVRARLAGALRPLRRFRGWMRVVDSVLPASASGEFLVVNDGTAFAGNLRSFIDRNVYLSKTALERLTLIRREARISKFQRTLLTHSVALAPASADLPAGDYLISPV